MKTSKQRAAEIFSTYPEHNWVVIITHPHTDKILMTKKYKKMPSAQMQNDLCDKLEAQYKLEEFSINIDVWKRITEPFVLT